MAFGNTAVFASVSHTAVDSTRRDLTQLSVGYVLILIVIWTPRPWQRLSYAVAATFLVATLWNARPGWNAMGFQTVNLVRSSWLIGVALVAAAIAVLIAAKIHTLHAPGGPILFVERYAGYALGACVQQIVLQAFVLPRLLRLTRNPESAAFVAAALFSLAHLPNPILTLVTLFWGLASCLFFLRYRNLYVLAVAHTILGITIAMIVPGPVIHNMRVGLGYLTYSRDHVHHRSY